MTAVGSRLRRCLGFEERIADLSTIRDTLRAAVDAGCEDLVACAANDCRPIPFATITPGRRPDRSRTGASGGRPVPHRPK
jgi:hypothetical protein